jgi:hypothetical protein
MIPKNETRKTERRTEDIGRKKNIVDLLAMPMAAAVEFEPQRLGDEVVRAADLS